MNQFNPTNAILGSLLGSAVGDALGLPYEGISHKRVALFLKNGLQHRLVFGRGMFSDDTEHTMMVAAAFLRHSDDSKTFQKALGRSLRWWFLALPAGVGLSTAKAIIRLWLGVPASRSGVWSAGNGAAMRSAIIGVIFSHDAAKRREFALAGCRLTHIDPRAEESALLVAEAAALSSIGAQTNDVISALETLVQSGEMKTRFATLKTALTEQRSVGEYASAIGCERGVSGFAPNTVAVALYAWLRHRGEFQCVLTEVIKCGGDTDSVASIAGGITGAETGEAGIPSRWIADICDWPRSVSYLRKLAEALSAQQSGNHFLFPAYSWIAVPVRNLFFLLVVLIHGFRRLLPPYGFDLK
jgi:ADP-ribosyl-[dinitrogen reductase] hydrolase